VAYLSLGYVTVITAMMDVGNVEKMTTKRTKGNKQNCPAQPHDPTCRHLAAGRAFAPRGIPNNRAEQIPFPPPRS